MKLCICIGYNSKKSFSLLKQEVIKKFLKFWWAEEKE